MGTRRPSMHAVLGAVLLMAPACTTIPSAPDNAPTAGLAAIESASLSNPVAATPEADRYPADFRERRDYDLDLIWEDYRNFYGPCNMLEVGLGVALAAPLANTRADDSFRDWYQRRVPRSTGLDHTAQFISYASEGWVAVPIAIEGMGLEGWLGDDYANDGGIGEWSNRAVRSMAVGTPTLLTTMVLLGANRPDALGDSSWHPFQGTHGASGHTFFGAIPFLTAAEMTDNPFLQVPLYAGSFLTGWSRIHLDQHYISQVALGWWLAYLSTRRVDDTNVEHRAWSLTPFSAEGPGIGVEFRY